MEETVMAPKVKAINYTLVDISHTVMQVATANNAITLTDLQKKISHSEINIAF